MVDIVLMEVVQVLPNRLTMMSMRDLMRHQFAVVLVLIEGAVDDRLLLRQQH
jgi:hypothetical protein